MSGYVSWASSSQSRKVMQGNRSVDTKPEVRLRSELHRRGLRFRKALRVEASGLRCRPDIVFTRARVAVFVDGCFWHRCPEHGTEPKSNTGYWKPKLDRNVDRDRRVDEALGQSGWKVVRVWEHETPHRAADQVAAAVFGAGCA